MSHVLLRMLWRAVSDAVYRVSFPSAGRCIAALSVSSLPVALNKKAYSPDQRVCHKSQFHSESFKREKKKRNCKLNKRNLNALRWSARPSIACQEWVNKLALMDFCAFSVDHGHRTWLTEINDFFFRSQRFPDFTWDCVLRQSSRQIKVWLLYLAKVASSLPSSVNYQVKI